MGNLEEYKKFKNTGIFVVLFGVESSQVYGKCSQTRQHTLALGQRNLNKQTRHDATQYNTTQHVDMHIQSHTD
jgi:hypothetical protein